MSVELHHIAVWMLLPTGCLSELGRPQSSKIAQLVEYWGVKIEVLGSTGSHVKSFLVSTHALKFFSQLKLKFSFKGVLPRTKNGSDNSQTWNYQDYSSNYQKADSQGDS